MPTLAKSRQTLDAGFLAAQAGTQCRRSGSGRLVANPERTGIERSHGLLKNHSHASAPDGAHFRFPKDRKDRILVKTRRCRQSGPFSGTRRKMARQVRAACRSPIPHYAGNGGPFQAEADIAQRPAGRHRGEKLTERSLRRKRRHNPRNPPSALPTSVLRKEA